jgi:folate-binding protein YgfZ
MNRALYDELKTDALLFDRAMGLLEVVGPDRVAWLQGMVSNDVARLSQGEGCYAAHLSPKGRVLAHMLVLADEDMLWLELERDNTESTIQELDKLLIMEDAELRDRSSEFAVLAIVGSKARSVLDEWSAAHVSLDSLYAHTKVGVARVIRADLGYDLIVELERLSELRESLVAAGAVMGDPDLWQCLRIEAGLPTYGLDIDSDTTLPELGDKGIDYEKGCYIGQEVVAKIRYIGHVNRRLVGLRCGGTSVPARGAKLSREGRDIGRVTSSVYSVGVESVICLGYVRLGSDAPGTEVEVWLDGESRPATVTELPFVSHQY